ncbi:carbohydrate-binding module family 48 protein [Daldinia decipiens]|uniref:carbohydrate-binding module family 48 protein n=1 Tax=Daldinia decipiens TaxID=326647 RepID=UPI0020C2C7F3|nr:carbohydrate-binding module family 48 protein [Daldinia decipiens]KAI1662714.1 carbohydrate-binding module family 48 protein [Daldinia decipiens]
MGTFLFKWEHPASEVYVTGTFDDWQKTEKLEKVGGHFEKAVTLKDASAKIFYKFVVDGNWVTDHTAPKEIDESGNENNILTPDRIIKEAPATAAIMSTVTPDSTTAALAADVPLEKKDEGLPGTFPETPAAELNGAGDFGVNPFPATAGAVNPIKLAPGEKIPQGLAANGTTDQVKLDPESYEKSDTIPGGLPLTLNSAAPLSTTAVLAGSVPLEPKVPEVVRESQEKAHVDPEASGIAEEVREKAEVESELLDKVKEAPTTSEGTAGKGTEKTEDVVTPGEAAASVLAAATAVGAAAVAGAVAAKDIAVEKATDAATAAQASAIEAAANLPDSVKEQLPESVQNAIGTTKTEETREEVSPEVPSEVKESIIEAGKAPEAAASTEAVEDKKAVEAELLKEVKTIEADKEESVKPTESTEAAGNSSEIRIPPASEPTIANGANGHQETVKPVEIKRVPTDTETTKPTAPATLAVPETTAQSTEATSPTSDTKPTNGAATEKKKKNRLSSIFGKVKSKLSSK